MTERRDVVILGSGPAAAGAVAALARAKIHDIVVLEREPDAGGVPRHCGHTGYGIREFGRLMTGPDYARRLAASMAGIDLRTGHTVRRLDPGGHLAVTGPDGSYEIEGRAVLLATGARETPRSARLIAGSRSIGVLTTGALQQFVYLEGQRPARRVVVLGSELVSFSALLTCRHGGIAVAALIEAGRRPVTYRPAGLASEILFGIPLLLETRLVEILGGERVEGVTVACRGETRRIDCDGVVVSGRFVPETSLLKPGPVELDTGSGGPVIDEFWRTSDPAYFAAGNLVHPIETAGRCFRDGLAAGAAMALALAERLPPPGPVRRILAGPGVKYLYPQRLAGYEAVPVEGRVREEFRGHVRVRLDGTLVWSRRVHLLPERRVRLPALPFARRFSEAAVELS